MPPPRADESKTLTLAAALKMARTIGGPWKRLRGARGGGAGAAAAMPEGERLYAIGDVHGRFDLLCELVSIIYQEQVDLPPAQTTVLFLGDLVDRGPESAQVVDLAMQLTGEGDVDESRVLVLKGNHEDAMLAAWHGDLDALRGWIRVGGHATLRSYGIPDTALRQLELEAVWRMMRDAVPESVIRWIERLPTHLVRGGYLFAHAGIRPGLPIAQQDDHDLMWIRDEFLNYRHDHGYVVVHGHTISPEVQSLTNRIGVDTGAFRSGRLSAICLHGAERRVVATSGEEPLLLG